MGQTDGEYEEWDDDEGGVEAAVDVGEDAEGGGDGEPGRQDAQDHHAPVPDTAPSSPSSSRIEAGTAGTGKRRPIRIPGRGRRGGRR